MSNQEIIDCQPGLDWVYEKYYAKVYEEPKQNIRNTNGQLDLEVVRKALSYIPSDEREMWIDIGHGLKRAGAPFEIYNEWSSKSAKYDAEDCKDRWDGYKPNRIGIGTIFRIAKEHGFEFSQKQKTSTSSNGGTTSSNSKDNNANDWPEDKPLYRELPPAEIFPMDALGDLLTPAAKRCHEVIQAPDSICAYGFLAGLNLAVQPHADVEIDGRVSPLSEFFVEIAESGDRKTGVDNIATAPHRAWQKQKLKIWEKDYAKYKSDMEVYGAARNEILKEKLSIEEKEKALDALKSPDAPLMPLLMAGEPTYEGVIKQLAAGLPSLGLFSNEGGRFIGGHAMKPDNILKTITGLSELWDCGEFDRLRSGDGASKHYGKRLSLHLMVQPDIGTMLFSNRLLINQGFVPRIIPAAPQGTQKKYQEIDISQEKVIVDYFSNITALLNTPLPLELETRNTLKPRRLRLSPQAKKGYIAFHDDIQKKVMPGKYLGTIRGFANKAHDHAARIAGELALGTDLQVKEISLEDFRRGVEIIRFAMSELLRLQGVNEISQHLIDSQRLLNWLIERGQRLVCIREIYHRGPNNLRTAEKTHPLLETLHKHGKIRPIDERVEYEGQKAPAWEVRAFANQELPQ